MNNKIFTIGIALSLLLAPAAFAESDRSGFDAAVPSTRQPGAYNNY